LMRRTEQPRSVEATVDDILLNEGMASEWLKKKRGSGL
jgi:hypothetical protein